MKTIILTSVAIFALSVSAASATGLKFGDTTNNYGGRGGDATAIAGASAGASANVGVRNTNTNVNHNAQGQLQGQGQFQGQGQTQQSNSSANNSNSVNNSIEGDDVEGSVGVALGVADCGVGFTLGLPGYGAFGISKTDTECKVIREAAMLDALGRRDLAIAHMSQIGRIKTTMQAVGYGESAAPVVSTRNASPAPRPAVAYSKCELADGRLTVRVRFGADRDLAVSQCRAANGL